MDNRYIILAIAVFLCLAVGIIFFVILYQRRVINHQIQLRAFNQQKQSELMQASIRSEEDERKRIAEELHDDVGATLSSIRLYLHQAALRPGDAALINETKTLLDESIQKVRNISHQLQPAMLEYLGLSKALQSLAEMINSSGSICMDFVNEVADWQEPHAGSTLSVYRIIQEMVSNITRHSGATTIQLTLHTEVGYSCISLAHNGNGLTEAAYREFLFKEGSSGLKNIEYRLKTANLKLQIKEPEDGIFTSTLCLHPLNENPQ